MSSTCVGCLYTVFKKTEMEVAKSNSVIIHFIYIFNFPTVTCYNVCHDNMPVNWTTSTVVIFKRRKARLESVMKGLL